MYFYGKLNTHIMDGYIPVLNAESIYRTLFFNIKTVTEFSHKDGLVASNLDASKEFDDLCSKRGWLDSTNLSLNELYHEKGCYMPEYSKIVSITYGNVYLEDGDMKRSLNSIQEETEEETIDKFFRVVDFFYNENSGEYVCGHNVNGFDIPFIIKRALKYNLKVPKYFKNQLREKPWTSKIIDTLTLWKMMGNDYTSLKLISTFLPLKYRTLPMDMPDLSKYYWKNTSNTEWINKESANQVNLTIQLFLKLRNM